jgi:hypothetical protein
MFSAYLSNIHHLFWTRVTMHIGPFIAHETLLHCKRCGAETLYVSDDLLLGKQKTSDVNCLSPKGEF